jgi:hypothetical protein
MAISWAVFGQLIPAIVLASLGEGGVHDQTKFGVQAAVSAALVN